MVRLNAAGPSGLTLAVRFSGSQRTTLYQYDSARLSLPTPGTGIMLNESFRWPDISEPAPPSTASAIPAPEPKDVAIARKRLTSLVSPLILAGLSSAAGGVQATFKAPKSHDVARFEERLRDAGIGYVVRAQPVWSANLFHFELLILPEGHVQAWRPSVLWVEQELRRSRHPKAEPLTVTPDPQGYRATLLLSGGVQAQEVAQRIRSLSGVFTDVVVQSSPAKPVASAAANPSPFDRKEALLLLVMK